MEHNLIINLIKEYAPIVGDLFRIIQLPFWIIGCIVCFGWKLKKWFYKSKREANHCQKLEEKQSANDETELMLVQKRKDLYQKYLDSNSEKEKLKIKNQIRDIEETAELSGFELNSTTPPSKEIKMETPKLKVSS